MNARRRGLLVWLLLLALLGGFGQGTRADDRRTDTSALVIMTLNGEFLWDGVAPEEGSVSFPRKGSQTEAEEHMRLVAQLVIQSNPDVVNLVEVENLAALTTFNDKFLTGRGYKPYFVQGNDTFTGQDVTLLTRIDPELIPIEREDRLGQSGSVKNQVSKNYVAKLTANGTKMALIGLHFLAQPLQEDRKLKREAQADAIRTRARELVAEGREVVVLGDFNDFDGETTSRDHVDSLPISRVLQIVREMDPTNTTDDLVNAASFVPKANRFTAFHDANDNGHVDPPNEETSIDHVLLSPALAKKVDLVEMPHTHDPLVVTDHFPIVVRLKFGGTPPSTVARLKIAALLPNPAGDENQDENATIKNLGTGSVSLIGWKLRDRANTTWSLDSLGTLAAGQEKTIKRNGQTMALNNEGDTIDLLDPMGMVVHTVTYGRADEGESILPAS